MLRDVPKGTKQRHDVGLGVVSQAVDHALAVATRADQSGAAQLLQMLRGVRHGEPDPFGQGFDAARSLGQLLDQFDPVLMAEGLGHLGQRRPDGSGGSPA